MDRISQRMREKRVRQKVGWLKKETVLISVSEGEEESEK